MDEEGHRLLDVIVSNTQIMSNLIDDLLALSRLGRQEIKKVNVDVTTMARQVFEQLMSQEPERNLQFLIKDLPSAHGDPSLLYQVMVNLLSNAIKYSKPGNAPIIEVDGKDGENETIYCFKDNGIGFDERYADKIFGVFQRLHGSNEYEGNGVGLAIVKRIVQRHGGRVWGEGKVDEGAVFCFALPKEQVVKSES
jgi:light-regulated signal transduction histidine kinase (bacteriophytochrome)